MHEDILMKENCTWCILEINCKNILLEFPVGLVLSEISVKPIHNVLSPTTEAASWSNVDGERVGCVVS